MQDDNNKQEHLSEEEQEARKKQQQSDPQLTELKGFIDPDVKLEPELEDDDETPSSGQDNKE